MLPISFIKSKKPTSMKFKTCINSTNIINNFLNSNICNVIPSSSLIPVAKLISICFIQNSFKLLINKNLLFYEFVLEKVKKLHGKKELLT